MRKLTDRQPQSKNDFDFGTKLRFINPFPHVSLKPTSCVSITWTLIFELFQKPGDFDKNQETRRLHQKTGDSREKRGGWNVCSLYHGEIPTFESLLPTFISINRKGIIQLTISRRPLQSHTKQKQSFLSISIIRHLGAPLTCTESLQTHGELLNYPPPPPTHTHTLTHSLRSRSAYCGTFNLKTRFLPSLGLPEQLVVKTGWTGNLIFEYIKYRKEWSSAVP